MNYVLISHGRLASGLLAAVEIILGKRNNVYAIDMYLDDQTIEEKVNYIFTTTNLNERNTIILTDIFGGSVNQKVIKMFDLEKIKVLTGMNLPLVLELLILSDDQITDEKLRVIVTEARKQVDYVNDLIFDQTFNDDF
ncbi:PTS sugar transporter subunit IIA [Enterococcus sp. DIV0086]|uniref:PTS sugar transporter subunit IIA n=1 Tax=Enterococcus sp. DIV0086 TaxID=2774655 RepID=UPI003D2D18D8